MFVPAAQPAPIAELVALIRQDKTANIRPGKDVFIARAPGRLDVMGGIADYTGSLVLEMPLDVAAAVAVQRRDDRKLILKTYNADAAHASPTVELSLDDFYGTAALLPLETIKGLFTGEKRWAAYVAGAFVILAKHRKLTRKVSGANIAVYSSVPPGSGVSSSAAIEVATLSALTAAYHLILEPLETAVLAQKVENLIVGAPCGVMDQVTSALGQANKLLKLCCQPHTIEGFVDVPEGLTFCGINSNVKHSVGGSAYTSTRIAAFMAHAIIARMYRDFGQKKDPTEGYLARITPDFYERYLRPILPEAITGADFERDYGETIDRVTTIDPEASYQVRSAADHHVLENARVHEFVSRLENIRNATNASLRHLDITMLGNLMLQSHQSYSNNANLGSRETDLLVNMLLARGAAEGIYGAKITGGGSGGTVAILIRDDDDARNALRGVMADYEKQTGLKPDLFTGSSPGATLSEPIKLATV